MDTETRNDKKKLERVCSGHFSLLFISPELLLLNFAIMQRNVIYINKLIAFVNDKAHSVCV